MLTEDESTALHMFFSPSRVVRGLTDQEVKVCINMYPLRRKQIALYPVYPPFLPDTLTDMPEENISRSQGIKDALYQIHHDLANPSASVTFN